MAPKFSRQVEDPRGSRLLEERVGRPHDPDLQREALRSKLEARYPDRTPSPTAPQETAAEAEGTGAAPCALAPEPAGLPGPSLNVSEVAAAAGSTPATTPQATQPAPRGTRPRMEVSVDASSSEPEGPPPKRATAQRTRTIPEDQEMQYDDEPDGSSDQDPILEEVCVIRDRPPASEASEAGSDVADLRDFGPTRAAPPAAATRGTRTANAMDVDGEARHATGGSQWRWYNLAGTRILGNRAFEWDRLKEGGSLFWVDTNGESRSYRWRDNAGYIQACLLSGYENPPFRAPGTAAAEAARDAEEAAAGRAPAGGPNWRWYDRADNRVYYDSDWTRLHSGGSLTWTDRNGNPCAFRWHDRAGYAYACTLEGRSGLELGADAWTAPNAGRRHSTPSQEAAEPDAEPWDAVWETEQAGQDEDWPSWDAVSRGTPAPPAAAAPGTEAAPAAATGPTPATGLAMDRQ